MSNKLFTWKEVLMGTAIASTFAFTNQYFEISKNLEILTSIYKEVNTYYVDDIEPAKFMRTGIDAMLKSLDPYTDYISESEIEDFRFMTTGQYGGIGALVSTRDSMIVITEPYEGFPAQKADIRAGDIILEIDGKTVKGMNSDEISRLLKGQPRTSVNLVLKREGETELLKKSVMREEISVKSVPYYSMLNAETGYVKYTGFKANSGQEVAEAIKALKDKNMKNLVLDLRDNPGGSLDEAIKISGFFIPKGSRVVDTKGKVKEWDKAYNSPNDPIDLQMPVVVLVNGGSASASEIVSGVLQDYDRALILGTKTYGKGLVQTVRPVAYNTQLKVTTAKYYTPSGRCVQAIHYSQSGKTRTPDSLKVAFKTKAGRTVYDAGGVTPDKIVNDDEYPAIVQNLIAQRVIFDFANQYRRQHSQIANVHDFALTDGDFAAFTEFVANKKFDYNTESEKMLEDFKKKAQKEGYFEGVKADYEALYSRYHRDKKADINKYKADIMKLLRTEIVSRYYYQKGKAEAELQGDPQLKEALNLLSDKIKYESFLKSAKK